MTLTQDESERRNDQHETNDRSGSPCDEISMPALSEPVPEDWETMDGK